MSCSRGARPCLPAPTIRPRARTTIPGLARAKRTALYLDGRRFSVNDSSQDRPSRRQFLQRTGRIAGALCSPARGHSLRPRGGGQHHSPGPDRLRRTGHRSPCQRPVCQERPDAIGRHGRRLPGPARRQLQAADQLFPIRSTCPQIAGSSASTHTNTRWIAFGPAMWRSLRRRRPSAGFISPTPSPKASTSSWRNP